MLSRSKTTVRSNLLSVTKAEAGKLETEIDEVLLAIFPEESTKKLPVNVVLTFLKENIDSLNRTLLILPCQCKKMHAFDYDFRVSRETKKVKMYTPHQYLEALNLHYMDIVDHEPSEISDDMIKLAKRLGNVHAHLFSEHRYKLEKDFAESLWTKCLKLIRFRAIYHKKYEQSPALRVLVKCMMLYNNHIIQNGYTPLSWIER